MEMITSNMSAILGAIMALAFVVNIIVQVTKEFIPLPTKLWCVITAMAVVLGGVLALIAGGHLELSLLTVVLSILGSFIIAFIAMYGFDTFKELWERFKKGENIND